MSDNKMNSWSNLLNSLGNLIGKLIWGIVIIIILSMIGRYLISSHNPQEQITANESEKTGSVPAEASIPWDEVDKQIVESLTMARSKAEQHANNVFDEWVSTLVIKVDNDFLPWYFNYWNQQWLGLKGVTYWTLEKLFDNQPTMTEKITEEIQEEFSKRVLRPQIAQMQLERMTEEIINVYVMSLTSELASIPEKYQIPEAEWQRYLDDIAVMTSGSEGNREVSLSLKTLSTTTVAGVVVGTKALIEILKPIIAKIGTKVTVKVAAKGSGKAVGLVAAKTGAKVSAKAGGKFLGPIVGVGIIIWDVWDHHNTKKVEKPILRTNIVDYLTEVKRGLIEDSDSGVMSILSSLENNIVSNLDGHI